MLRKRVAVKRLSLKRAENHHLERTGKEVSLVGLFLLWGPFHRGRLLSGLGLKQSRLGLEQNSIKT